MKDRALMMKTAIVMGLIGVLAWMMMPLSGLRAQEPETGEPGGRDAADQFMLQEMEQLLQEMEWDILLEQFRDLRLETFRLEKDLKLLIVEEKHETEAGEKEELGAEIRMLEEQVAVLEEWGQKIRAELMEKGMR